MEFEEILYRAQMGNKQAVEQIVEMYQPLLIKNALVDGAFDKELHQDLITEIIKCIRDFRKIELQEHPTKLLLVYYCFYSL